MKPTFWEYLPIWMCLGIFAAALVLGLHGCAWPGVDTHERDTRQHAGPPDMSYTNKAENP